MDAPTAESLLAIAEQARTGMRASDSAAIEAVEARYAEITEAMDWCLGHGRADDAYRFATALVPFWMATKRIDDGDRWFTGALEEPAGSSAGRARATYDHGYLVFWAGRYELAEERLADARTLAASIGDPDLEALALAGLARVALINDVSQAIRLLRRAVEVSEGLPDSPGRSSALHVLGVALQMSGDLAGARQVMTQRLQRGRETGNASIIYIESANLSMVERKLGNLEAAEALSLEALRTVVAMHNELAIPWVINGLAAVTAAKGDLWRAATLLGIADGLLERAGGEWPPDEREQHDETLATLQDGLAPATLDERRAAGAAMALEDGVAYALDGGVTT